MKALAGTLILVIGAVALTAIVFKIFMRKARAEAHQSEYERMMEEDGYRLAKARLVYRRNHKQETDADILAARFGVEIPTEIRSDENI